MLWNVFQRPMISAVELCSFGTACAACGVGATSASCSIDSICSNEPCTPESVSSCAPRRRRALTTHQRIQFLTESVNLFRLRSSGRLLVLRFQLLAQLTGLFHNGLQCQQLIVDLLGEIKLLLQAVQRCLHPRIHLDR